MLIGRSVRPPLPSPSRTSLKIVAVVVGIFATGDRRSFLFNAWLKQAGRRRGWRSRRRGCSGSAEMQIGQTVGAARRPGHARRRFVPAGSCRCDASDGAADRADQAGHADRPEWRGALHRYRSVAGRRRFWRRLPPSKPGIMLDVVRLAGSAASAFCASARSANRTSPALAALVPASLLLPQAPTLGGRLPGYARIAMADGTPVGGRRPSRPTRPQQESCSPTRCDRSNTACRHGLDAAHRRDRATMTIYAASAW